jgi:hypothetical protein
LIGQFTRSIKYLGWGGIAGQSPMVNACLSNNCKATGRDPLPEYHILSELEDPQFIFGVQVEYLNKVTIHPISFT